MKRELREETKPLFHMGKSTIIILIFFLALFISFYYLLNQQVPTKEFGWQQILMAVTIAVIATAVLSLSRGIMHRNPELGLATGVTGIIIALVALFSIYRGPYTTKFAIAGSLAAAIYIGWAFWRNRKH